MIILPIFPHLTILQSPCLPINREYDATVLMMYGAHVIRAGNGLFMIELMKRGFVTHFATNGAGSILDFEFALKGNTCESVAKYISEGQFGLWTETGIINEHPNVDGASTGICSYNDFLIYAKSIQNPEHSVFPDFCSAVAGPEVYL